MSTAWVVSSRALSRILNIQPNSSPRVFHSNKDRIIIITSRASCGDKEDTQEDDEEALNQEPSPKKRILLPDWPDISSSSKSYTCCVPPRHPRLPCCTTKTPQPAFPHPADTQKHLTPARLTINVPPQCSNTPQTYTCSFYNQLVLPL